MNTSLSSETARVGQGWSATVFQDVYVGGELAIPSGSIVEGHVISVDDADRFQESGKIAIDFDRIVFPNGGRLENINAMLTSLDPQIRAHIDEESRITGSRSQFKNNVYFIGGGAAGGALIGAIAGGGSGAGVGAGVGAVGGLILSALNKGREVNIPAGTEFGMELLNAVTVPINYLPGRRFPTSTFTTSSTTVSTQSIQLTRSDILDLQRALRSRGYYRGAINGIFTAATRNALIEFQDDNNLSQTGRVDTRTADILGLDLNIVSDTYEDLSRAEILSLQRALRSRGFYRGALNGIFTAATRRALSSFQEDNDLTVSGRIDFRTAQLLGLDFSDVSDTPEVGELDPNGQPTFMGVGSTHRFIIWRDGNWWHVRTTTAGQRHSFEGRIVANGGTIRSLSRTGTLERVDQLLVDRTRRGLDFDFVTAGAMDGFDFYSDADTLTFDLSMDGRRTERNVYVGRHGTNPVSIPFTLVNE